LLYLLIHNLIPDASSNIQPCEKDLGNIDHFKRNLKTEVTKMFDLSQEHQTSWEELIRFIEEESTVTWRLSDFPKYFERNASFSSSSSYLTFSSDLQVLQVLHLTLIQH